MFNLFCFFKVILNFFFRLFAPFNNFLKTRYEFEKGNAHHSHHSFRLENKTADILYEVSSEGELEQVRALIERDLSLQKKIELVYFSNSVTHQCTKLYDQYPDQIRLFRYPALSFNPLFQSTQTSLLKWASANSIVFCRYDFFPQILHYARTKCIKRVLVSASLKGKDLKSSNIFKNWLHRYIYTSFDWVIATTFKDKSLFEIHFDFNNSKVHVCDFRFLRINLRQSQARETLLEKIQGYEALENYLTSFRHRLIAGSFWANEGLLFNQNLKRLIENKEIALAIAPHDLSNESLVQIKLAIKEHLPSLPIYELKAEFTKDQTEALIHAMEEKPGVLIFNMKGVLCEMYTIFNQAFVGGGHGRSVHSLLEPYLAGCKLLCGPKVHRSTEYDIIVENSPKEIVITQEAKNFSEAVELFMQRSVDASSRSNLIAQMESTAQKIEKEVFES